MSSEILYTALLSVTMQGGIGAAYGIAVHMNPAVAFAIASLLNIAMCALIAGAMDAVKPYRLYKKLQRLLAKPVTFGNRLLKRYGYIGISIATPVISPYTAMVACKFIGVGNIRALCYVALGTLLTNMIYVVASLGIIKVIA